MTRKDYLVIADALAESRPMWAENRAARTAQWVDTVDCMARALAHDNPRFDVERFLMATQAPKRRVTS